MIDRVINIDQIKQLIEKNKIEGHIVFLNKEHPAVHHYITIIQYKGIVTIVYNVHTIGKGERW